MPRWKNWCCAFDLFFSVASPSAPQSGKADSSYDSPPQQHHLVKFNMSDEDGDEHSDHSVAVLQADHVEDDEDDDDDEEVLAAVVVDASEEDDIPVAAAVVVPSSNGSLSKPRNSSVGGKGSSKKKKKHIALPDCVSDARAMLQEGVPTLPMWVSETYLRSFGRLWATEDDHMFATPTALYPIGFNCDRYEFSPVHGRTLKLRCSILDGKHHNSQGPIFRVMWGQGIDEENDTSSYQYDPYKHSAPLVSREDSVEQASMIPPEEGMRVRVRFDEGAFSFGVIQSIKKQ
jgi:hypothetical protein